MLNSTKNGPIGKKQNKKNRRNSAALEHTISSFMICLWMLQYKIYSKCNQVMLWFQPFYLQVRQVNKTNILYNKYIYYIFIIYILF